MDEALSPFCAVYTRAIEIIGRRWTGAILRALIAGRTRFNDIAKTVPGLSDRLLAEHLTSEYRVQTEGRGRTVDEWKLRLAGSDNHWLDCLVGAAVAASMQGAVLFGTDAKPVARQRVRLSNLQRRRS